MYNLLIGGAAGDGIETTADLLEKSLMRSGLQLFSMRDFMSRVRGGHNFAQIRFGAAPMAAHRRALDVLVALDEETWRRHKADLRSTGAALCDPSIPVRDGRAIPVELHKLAKQAGNPKTVGSVCIGALLRMFGIGPDAASQVMREALPEKILEANLAALSLGYNAVEQNFTPVPPRHAKSTACFTGAQAMALGAVAGGLRFYSGYPMSPSTTLLEFFTQNAPEFRLGVEQAEDEIAAINMALGAAYAGARAMAGTSGGGFALMVEALGFAGIAELPIVLADVQRPGPATGLPTRTEQSDLSFVLHAAPGEFPRFVTAVRSHADAFYATARAFRLAWQYQVPVILLSDQYLADSGATLPLPSATRAAADAAFTLPRPTALKEGENYLRYKLAAGGVSPLRLPGQSEAHVRVDSDEHDESGRITESARVRTAMVDKRLAKMRLLKSEAREPDYVGVPEPELLFLGFGSTAGALSEAVEEMNARGERTGALLFGDVWPLPARRLRKYAGLAKRVVNVEQNATGQLARLIKAETAIQCAASILKYDGRQLSVDDILYGAKRELRRRR